MALPFVPGLSPYNNSNMGREDFLKPQIFTFLNKERYVQPDSTLDEKNSCANNKRPSFICKPPWEAFDKRVLAFEAYLLEPIYLVSPSETYRRRKFKIHYFLENDTMEVVEPHQRNSGMLQGIFFQRRKVKKPSSDRDVKYYTLFELNVNMTLEINGYLFKIVNCDPFTRTFLAELGITVDEPAPEPVDPYEKQRKTMEDNPLSKIPRYKAKDKLGPFLKYDGLNLIFNCLWEEKCIFQSVRQMELRYFLSDDTIEIVEKRLPNCGRIGDTMFLKRCKLPKSDYHSPKPWEKVDQNLLAVGGTVANYHRYFSDSNPVQESPVEPQYYTDKDFDLGQDIIVYGRKFFIYDCDDFTREFYFRKYGKNLKPPVSVPEIVQPVQTREIMPTEPVGNYEQTIRNCFNIHHNRKIKNWLQYFSKDTYGWKKGQLIFTADLLSEDPVDKTRKFVITYYLKDGTLGVYEPYQANNGIIHGQYIERNQMLRPVKPELKATEEPSYYGPEDLFVGNVLQFYGHDFIITGADEASLRYFEDNCNLFPHSDAANVLKNIKHKLVDYSNLLESYFQSIDTNQTGFVPFDAFRKTILEIVPEEIPEQEVITLSRHYAHTEAISIPLLELVTGAQTELRKRNFNDFKEVTLAMKAYDLERTGYFAKEQLYQHLRGAGVPLTSDTLKLLINSFPSTEDGHINYADFLFALDYFNNPVRFSSKVPSVADINWARNTNVKSLEKINYAAFIKELRS